MFSYLRMGVLSALAVGLLSQGCSEDRAALEKKILAHDSSFQRIVDKRDSLQQELASQEEAFSKRQQETSQAVEALKDRQRQEKKEHAVEMKATKRKLWPEKKRLEMDLLDMERRYKRVKENIRDIGRDIDEINTLMEKKNKLVLTPEEIQAWNERLNSLIKDEGDMVSEKDKLQTDISMTKLKIKVLGL
ncbi:MAG: hypothetical protein ABIH74_02635 [Candidatus Omnitrophota bacterium]